MPIPLKTKNVVTNQSTYWMFLFPLKCLFVDHSSILSDRSVYSFLRWLAGWLSIVHFIPCLSFLFILFILFPRFLCIFFFAFVGFERKSVFIRSLFRSKKKAIDIIWSHFIHCFLDDHLLSDGLIELLCNKYIPEWLNRHTAKHTHCVFCSIIFRTLSINLAIRFCSLKMPDETKNKRRQQQKINGK